MSNPYESRVPSDHNLDEAPTAQPPADASHISATAVLVRIAIGVFAIPIALIFLARLF